MIQVIQKPVHADNWRKGPGIPRVVRAAVIHIAEGSEKSVDSWFNNPRARVSAHFLVGLDGELRQYVGIHDVAYHAGTVDRPTWVGYTPGTTNSQTIGIEHEGSGKTPWPEAMLTTSVILSAWLATRFGWVVDEQRFPLHSEIRMSKPFCPGAHFDRKNYLERVRAVQQVFGDSVKNLIVGIR